jgi:hypothetical protein
MCLKWVVSTQGEGLAATSYGRLHGRRWDCSWHMYLITIRPLGRSSFPMLER